MQSRFRIARQVPDFFRAPLPSRFFHALHSRRSIAVAVRCLELFLLAGILLAFAAGMVRLR